MSERLRPDDMAFLVTESASTPMHNATLEIFEPPASGFDYDRLVALIGDRIAFVPRYRQRLRSVPGRLANPVWADDEDFDLTYHVRRSALPRPGSIDQLRDLTGRILSRRLDRHRPLWEMYFIEGLEGGRFAILSKSHQILVDGVATIDLGQVILDVDPVHARQRARRLAPAPRPERLQPGPGRRPRLGARPAPGPGHAVRQRGQRVPHRERRGRQGRPRWRARCPTAARRRSPRSTPRCPSSAGS